MIYSVKLGGKKYNLPSYTVKIENACKEVIDAGKRYNLGEIPAVEFVASGLDFLTAVVGEEATRALFPSGDADEIDINEVDDACYVITSEYNRPAREKQIRAIEEQMAPVHKVLSEKGMPQALDVIAARK